MVAMASIRAWARARARTVVKVRARIMAKLKFDVSSGCFYIDG